MGFGSNEIGLLFRAKGDTDDAKKAFSSLQTSITKDLGVAESRSNALAAGIGKSMGLSEMAVSGLALGVGILAVGFTAASAVAIGLAESLFSLTKSASEYGSEIHDAKDKTGLTAETLSALKVAADNSSSSLEAVTGGAAKFAKTLGAARDGNAKAREELKALGVTSYDLDTALSQATKTIFEAKDGTDQIVLSQKAFGKAGADLIPVIKQFGGDLEGATKEAIRLGETLSEKDIVASDNFGDALGTLGAQAKAAAVAFTSDLMPILTSFFSSASEWYARNQNEVRAWGSTIADTVSGSIILFNRFGTAIHGIDASLGENQNSWLQWANNAISNINRVILAITTAGISEFFRAAKNAGEEARNNQVGPFSWEMSPSPQKTSVPKISSGSGKGGGGASPKDDKAQQEKKDLDISLQRQQRYLKRVEEAYKETSDQLEKAFAKTGDEAAYSLGAKAAVDTFRNSSAKIIAEMESLEARRAEIETKQKETANEKGFREEKIQDRRDEINKKTVDGTEKVNKQIKDAANKLADDRLKIEEDFANRLEKVRREFAEREIVAQSEQYDQEIADAAGNLAEQTRLRDDKVKSITALLQAEHDRKIELLNEEEKKDEEHTKLTIKNEADQLAALKTLHDIYNNARLLSDQDFKKAVADLLNSVAVNSNAVPSPFQHLIDSWKAFKEEIKNSADLQHAFADIGQMGLNVMQNMRDALSSAVEGWLLYGDSVGVALRKALAAELAHVAAVAVIHALEATALGFLRLAMWDFVGAGHAFVSAALWAALAGTAAVGAKVVAGDAFKKQTATATSSNSQNSNGQQQHQATGNGGKQYSSQEDQVIEGGGNTAGPSWPMMKGEVTVNLKLDQKGLLQAWIDDVNNNGQSRQVLLKHAS